MKNGVSRATGNGTWTMLAFLARHTLRSFLANRGLQHAAMLAYFGFLALMPMLLLSVFLLGQALASSVDVEDALSASVLSVFPTFNPAVLDDLTGLAGRKSWGLLSVLLLAWSMTPFAGAFRGALAGVFKEDRQLHFVRAKFRDLISVFLLIAVFLGFAVLRVVLSGASGTWRSIESLATLPLSALILSLVYRGFSPVKLAGRVALAGGVLAALLLALLRPVFDLLLTFNPGFGYAFGSLKAIFLLLVWVYYLFVVVLLGAEFSANLHRRESLLLRGLFSGENGPRILLGRFERALAAGAVLFNEGDEGREMFHLIEGEIELLKAGRSIKRVLPGEYFGEMSLLLKAPRSATAVASQDCRLVVISEDNLDRILRENPAIMMSFLREMGERLKTTTARVVPPSD